jgi:DNA replication and repair protein RecF
MEYHYDPEMIRKDYFIAKLEQQFERNCLRGSLSTGPHHDEINISVSGKQLRNYGSRGQCRISALSMQLAELELISEQFGSFTVLVDDAFSDLDLSAKKSFLQRVSKAEQTYYAFTELPVEKEFSGAHIINLGENG